MNRQLFLKFASISFQKQITYRFDYFMGILNGFLYVFVFTSLWRALYNADGMSNQGGFTLTSITTYAIMAMAVRISFSMNDNTIYKKVQDGSVAIDLIRPVSFFFMNLAEAVGHSSFHTVARAIPIILISAFLFEIDLPFEPIRIFIFFISAILGYLIFFMINFMTGLLAFWFVEIFPFMLFKYGAFTLFSGAIVPIDFFPDSIKSLVDVLPFRYILYTPTAILTGHIDLSLTPRLLFWQLIWVSTLAVASKIMWNAGRNKLVIQGG